MRALVQGASPLSLAARRLGGARAALWPAAGVLRQADIRPLDAPPPGWVRLEPILAGICGSDLAALVGHSPTVLWPVVSFPAVPGHEVVARVAEVGPGVEGFGVGERVVVDPFVSCHVRGLEPCAACRVGQTALCRHSADTAGGLGPGMMIGYHRDLPGGWSEGMRAHVTQLHRVPAVLDDRLAVLTEPLAVALHGVLEREWSGRETVLIAGGGTIGLLCVAALALVGGPRPAIAVRYPHQAEAARRLGAHVLGPHDGAWARAGGARAVRGWAGRPLWLGGFDVTIDAVGSDRVLAHLAQATRAGGTIVRVGDVGTLPHARAADVWAPDVRILQPFGYGREASGEHTFALALDGLGRLDGEAMRSLVTHVFPLTRYRDALRTAFGHREHASIKVAFAPDDGARPPA